MFKIEDYDYDLPEELIAQVPPERRDGSRLLVVERHKKVFFNQYFRDLPRLLKPGDLLVANNTKVMPARLFGRKESGGQVEVLVLEHQDPAVSETSTRWCLLKCSKRPKKGSLLFFENGVSASVEHVGDDGLTRITFQGVPSVDRLIEEKGMMPVPPYIKRGLRDDRSSLDRERYQTIFSKSKGAVAAPTAGLHFTQELIDEMRCFGVNIVEITLHVGHGTFKPVRSRDIRDHKLGEEEYFIDRAAADVINGARREQRRVIAIGTTVVRTLETAVGFEGEIKAGRGKTDLLITPGFQFRIVDAILTNFHLPRSSLLFLVSAFAGMELVREAYRHAIADAYRFYSYGDAMLII